MSDVRARSPVHNVVLSLWSALKQLNPRVAPADVERWGFAVHLAMSSTTRDFHTHEHVMAMLNDASPLESIAALYHDTVYVQVDLGVPPSMEEVLRPLVARDGGGWRILEQAAKDPVTRDVLEVFARKAGEKVTTLNGLNELASTFVAVKELETALDREQRIAVAACIEATIPFRENPGEGLAARLAAMGLDAQQVKRLVTAAMRVVNRDVENFAEQDPALFLDHTWRLLPETNPSLNVPNIYSVAEYRLALMKMENFLAQLDARRVFPAWGGEPSAADHNRRVDAARRNISIAVRYLRMKLYAVGMAEAMCLETGGNMPVNYFMGGVPSAGGPMLRRLEQFLPEPTAAPEPLDPVLHRLLVGGRATPSSFDIAPAPLATYLYTTLGEKRVSEGVEAARPWWESKATPLDFLRQQPRKVVADVATAAAQIANTREALLLELAKQFT